MVCVSPEDIREALRLPDSFVCRDDRVGVTWGLGPTLETRDSGFAAEANAQALRNFLEGHPEVEDDWYVMRASHWGCGWVDQIVFKVLDPERGPSRMFELLMEWQKEREEFPIADEELYAEGRKEAALETIRYAHGIHVKTEAPDTWVEEVFEYLEEHGQIQDEPSGDLYIDSKDINFALRALEYYDFED